jgi:hypothetical protein
MMLEDRPAGICGLPCSPRRTAAKVSHMMPSAPIIRARLPLLAMALLTLLAGLWAGLLRIGWGVPAFAPGLALAHGPLMVAGFLGTVISLERAVALERRWAYLAPLLHALGAMLALALPGPIGPTLVTLGAVLLVLIFVAIMRHQPALFTAVMLCGALIWLIGNLLWLSGRPIAAVVPWWAGFLVLTIAGERLELGRLRQLPMVAISAFLLIVVWLCSGLLATLLSLDLGARIVGGSLVALALWLLRYDIARRTIRRSGVTRFIAVCMLSGYGWLGVSGALGIMFGGVLAGLGYDALLHALFLGFVFAMIFGHAPIILPAVLRIPVTFTGSFYAPLVLLHVSLTLRVLGDLLVWPQTRRWGGLLNVLVLLAFFANMVWVIRRSKATQRQTTTPASAPR